MQKINNKGITIVELIVSLSLVAIIMVMVMQILLEVRNEESLSEDQINKYVDQAFLISAVQQDLTTRELIPSDDAVEPIYPSDGNGIESTDYRVGVRFNFVSDGDNTTPDSKELIIETDSTGAIDEVDPDGNPINKTLDFKNIRVIYDGEVMMRGTDINIEITSFESGNEGFKINYDSITGKNLLISPFIGKYNMNGEYSSFLNSNNTSTYQAEKLTPKSNEAYSIQKMKEVYEPQTSYEGSFRLIIPVFDITSPFYSEVCSNYIFYGMGEFGEGLTEEEFDSCLKTGPTIEVMYIDKDFEGLESNGNTK